MKLNKKDLIILIITISIIVIGYFSVKCYLNYRYNYYIISGDSMNPNIKSGAELRVDKLKKIKRYDIVILEVGNSILVKRIIGLPSDKLNFTSDDQLFINGDKANYPFEIIGTTRNIDEEIYLDYQFYYVLGDNRDNAYDSRSFGKVSKSQIIGVVVDVNNP